MPFKDQMPQNIIAYHQRSKHSLIRYALGPAMLDWDNQPNPFRQFDGARQISLPLSLSVDDSAFADLDHIPPQSIDAKSLGLFLELALGLSAWKDAGGARWALRNNPSSGNLHPTEGWLILPPMAEIGHKPGLYHYTSLTHALEERAIFGQDLNLVPGGFLMALSTIPWREAWKYGERAFRYCQHDVGHAVAAITYAAACVGWKVTILSELSDDQIAVTLGLNRAEASNRFETEHADLALAIGPSLVPSPWPSHLPVTWAGAANRLSHDHDSWPAIDYALHHSAKPLTAALPPLASAPSPKFAAPALSAPTIIRHRRSAQRMDGQTALPLPAFYRMLAQTLPDPAALPWNAFPWQARIHLFLFIHRVDGLVPGLYVLIRDPAQKDRLHHNCSPDFLWQQPENCPLPLYLLKPEDLSKTASRLSCQQAIAGWGAFSLGMVADFQRTLTEEGDWAYRRLFWETGIIGQVLYLEATAWGLTGTGIQGTGIGCFYDDDFHDLLGFKPGQLDWQSLYHFTIGGALNDSRLSTLPAYDATRSMRPVGG